MLSARELESSPLFRNITYEEYRRMLTCFQAVQRSYLTEETGLRLFAPPGRMPSASWSAAACP